MTDTFNLVKSYANRIENKRTVESIYNHGSDEFNRELKEELDKKILDIPQGLDGIIGESIDVIVCMFDLIMMEDPSFTSEDFHNYLDKKLRKWEKKYNISE